MLTVVFHDHYRYLDRRLSLQDQLIDGPTVPTVVVFDEDTDIEQFCHQYPKACRVPGFTGVSFRSIVGDILYSWIRKRFFSRDGYDPPALNPEWKQMPWQWTNHRAYQSLKKFYGGAYARSQCDFYMLSDAESFPFKRHNLSFWLQKAAHKPFVVSGEWFDDRWKCEIKNSGAESMRLILNQLNLSKSVFP